MTHTTCICAELLGYDTEIIGFAAVLPIPAVVVGRILGIGTTLCFANVVWNLENVDNIRRRLYTSHCNMDFQQAVHRAATVPNHVYCMLPSNWHSSPTRNARNPPLPPVAIPELAPHGSLGHTLFCGGFTAW